MVIEIFKLNFGYTKKKYDLVKEDERHLMMNNILLHYMQYFPLFTNSIMALADIEDVGKDEKKTLAYTYFNFLNERIKIHINFDMIEKYQMNIKEITYLIFHEYLHNYFFHFIRMKKEMKEDIELANIVEDYYINEMLNISFHDAKKTFEKKGIMLVEQSFMENFSIITINKEFKFTFDDKPVENIMFKWFKDNGCKSKSNSSDLSSSGENSQSNDDKDEQSNKQKQQLDDHQIGLEKMKQSMKNSNTKRKSNNYDEISEADMDALVMQKINTVEESIIKNIGYSKAEIPYIRMKEEIFKKDNFLNMIKIIRIINKSLRESVLKSYKRISRKRVSEDIIYKGKYKIGGKRVVLAIDVSGSITDEELKKIYEMANGFLSNKKQKTVLDVIYWSSGKIIPKKHFHENITSMKELMELKINSYGGTNIVTLHEFIEDYYKEPIVLINITDGDFCIEGAIPEKIKQYIFVLTDGRKEDSIKEFNDRRISVEIVK